MDIPGPERKERDRERLLPGERRAMASSDPSDAENWRSVYLDLMSFKHHIISETRRRLREIAAPARAELRRDLAMLEGELGRLVGRYDYWAREARERTARRS